MLAGGKDWVNLHGSKECAKMILLFPFARPMSFVEFVLSNTSWMFTNMRSTRTPYFQIQVRVSLAVLQNASAYTQNGS